MLKLTQLRADRGFSQEATISVPVAGEPSWAADATDEIELGLLVIPENKPSPVVPYSLDPKQLILPVNSIAQPLCVVNPSLGRVQVLFSLIIVGIGVGD